MQYCLVKSIEILPFATKYMDLECIIFSEMRQINTACCILYVESKKLIQMILLTKQKQIHRYKNQTCGYQRGKWRMDK